MTTDGFLSLFTHELVLPGSADVATLKGHIGLGRGGRRASFRGNPWRPAPTGEYHLLAAASTSASGRIGWRPVALEQVHWSAVPERHVFGCPALSFARLAKLARCSSASGRSRQDEQALRSCISDVTDALIHINAEASHAGYPWWYNVAHVSQGGSKVCGRILTHRTRSAPPVQIRPIKHALSSYSGDSKLIPLGNLRLVSLTGSSKTHRGMRAKYESCDIKTS